LALQLEDVSAQRDAMNIREWIGSGHGRTAPMLANKLVEFWALRIERSRPW
jgi:hypothetical protein